MDPSPIATAGATAAESAPGISLAVIVLSILLALLLLFLHWRRARITRETLGLLPPPPGQRLTR
jgi:hypothetical protein